MVAQRIGRGLEDRKKLGMSFSVESTARHPDISVLPPTSQRGSLSHAKRRFPL